MTKYIDAEKLKQHYAWWNNDEKETFDAIIDCQPAVTKQITVNELFDGFSYLFDYIEYVVPDEDNGYLRGVDSEGGFLPMIQNEFEIKYGDYFVKEWQYDFSCNTIKLVIAKI